MRLFRFIFPVALALLPFCLSCQNNVKQYRVEVVREYAHDTASYTQGLFFHSGKLYESTGQYGESTLRQVDLETGEAIRRVNFSDKYFMEGSVIFGDSLYLLTWTNKVAFVYDAETLKYSSTHSYPIEGWGLTTDGKCLIASDGSPNLYFMNPDFSLQRRLAVKMDGKPVRFLNELEYIDGKIWANVYLSDLIVIIDPKSGEVEGSVNCAGLLPKKLRAPRTDVLNGIACNDGRIYLTGKYWPRLYEVRLVKDK